MKIAVIGSTNMDQIATVDALPQIGETVTATHFQEILGGKGCNQAVALATLGADVSFYTAVGHTAKGKDIIKQLRNKGLDVSHIKLVEDASTGTALITIDQSDNTIVVVPGANDSIDIPYIQSHIDKLLHMDIIVLQNEIPLTTIQYVLETFHDKVSIVYNPAPYKPLPIESYNLCDYLIPNQTEFNHMMKQGISDRALERCIITLGKDGALIKKEETIIPAIQCSVVDPTGAGDAFVAGLTYALSKDHSLTDAVKFANAVAAISTEKIGAQSNLPTYQETLKKMQ